MFPLSFNRIMLPLLRLPLILPALPSFPLRSPVIMRSALENCSGADAFHFRRSCAPLSMAYYSSYFIRESRWYSSTGPRFRRRS